MAYSLLYYRATTPSFSRDEFSREIFLKRAVIVVSEDADLIHDIASLLVDDLLEPVGVVPNQTEVVLKEYMPVSAAVVDGRLDEALRQVRSVRTITPDLPVILVASTYSDQEEIEVRQLGAFYCMIGKGEYSELYRFLMRASELAN